MSHEKKYRHQFSLLEKDWLIRSFYIRDYFQRIFLGITCKFNKLVKNEDGGKIVKNTDEEEVRNFFATLDKPLKDRQPGDTLSEEIIAFIDNHNCNDDFIQIAGILRARDRQFGNMCRIHTTDVTNALKKYGICVFKHTKVIEKRRSDGRYKESKDPKVPKFVSPFIRKITKEEEP